MTKSEKATNEKIVKAFVKFSKRNGYKSFQSSDELFKIAIEIEQIHNIDRMNKSFYKMLFLENEQKLIKDYAKFITNIAENSESINKFKKYIKNSDNMLNYFKTLNGDTFTDSFWASFKHVQISNTKSSSNIANLKLEYELLIKACYLLKYHALQMNYKTVSEIEREKATVQNQVKEQKKADALIAKALKAMSEKDKTEFLAKFASL